MCIRDRGLELSTDPEAYLESYLGYEMKPNEDPDADWRLDVMVGSTCCVPLINGYLNADNDFMDALHADGAAAGFFCYPLDTLREEEGSEKIFDFRDRLEEALAAGDGPDVLTLTGGATGLFCGYVDFIAWDIRAVLQLSLIHIWTPGCGAGVEPITYRKKTEGGVNMDVVKLPKKVRMIS